MISKALMKFLFVMISKFMDFTGLEVDIIPDWLSEASGYVLLVFEKGVSMVSFLIPNQTVYNFLINTTVDLFSAMLIFELIALFTRLISNFKNK